MIFSKLFFQVASSGRSVRLINTLTQMAFAKTSTPPIGISTTPVPNKPVPIVAIGGSAGALEAISELLKNLSSTLGLAYVYVQHLDPNHVSQLSTILGRVTSMPVREAEHEMRIQPNEVYIIPPNKDMEVVDGVLTLVPRRAKPYLHLPIDQFFVSLAERQKVGAIAVVLSGMASDGTVGLKAIKRAGGFTFAQDDSAQFTSMPRSAIAAGVVDLVLPPADIAREIERLSQKAELFDQIDVVENEETAADTDEELREILHHLRKTVGVDFSHYKMSTIRRRVARRMVLHRLETLSDYERFLRKNPSEVEVLYGDLLINVTRFFRDPETTDYLQSAVLPRLVRKNGAHVPIRVWVPGCSTGEEAYSLAMLLLETIDNQANEKPVAHTPIQIFASDLSEKAIQSARLGIYTRAELADVSPKRLQRFFTKVDDHYRVVKSIRDVCVFAPHNLFGSPPFSRLDLISCCNLLIYLDPSLQKQALTTFHYALNPGGHLLLGKSETVGADGALFSQVKKGVKLYARKNATISSPAFELSTTSKTKQAEGPRPRTFSPRGTPSDGDLNQLVEGLLLTRFVPASVVVNHDLDILQFRGSTGLFLEPAPGRASLHLLKMARPELVFELRSLVQKARKAGKALRKTGLQLKHNNKTHHVTIEAVPLKSEANEHLFLVVFQETTPPEADKIPPTLARDRRIKQLEAELTAAREDMRAIVEEQEASNEELQSANEEIVSSNEELQSINEELETSKEEIESSNEELITINQELQVRNDQLADSYEYADAIFGTLREATLLLDVELRVRSANDAYYRIFKTTPEETEGQLVYELGNGQWNIPALRKMMDDVVPENSHFEGFEVIHNFPGIGEKVVVLNGRMVVQHIHRREMVLLAIEDISEHRRAQRLVEERETWLRTMTDNAPVLIWVANAKGTYNFLNKTGQKYLGNAIADELRQTWAERIHPDDRADYERIHAEGMTSHQPYRVEYRLQRHDGEYRWMLEDGKPLVDADGTHSGYMSTTAEVHDQKLQNEELERRVAERTQALVSVNASLERSNEELRQYAYVASHDLQEPMRKVTTFASRLKESNADVLTPQGQTYLTKIINSAQRMTRLIDELLVFSRTVREVQQFVPTNLNDVLRDVLQDFDLLIAETGATIQADELPTIEAMPLQMNQLFHNLISNALKFWVKTKPPVIHIEAHPADAAEVEKRLPGSKVNELYWKIIVRDNGIGFDSDFAEQIFSIFQRLHDKSTYLGTGIGLALCRRIANNHGGEIVAESKEGEGAAFHVLLPAKQQVNE